ncbi:hydroxysteroid 11-beta-dehydrogenase 1-like protein [Saccoglossus kowalevskii]|uniref:Hydroxysteroid 11-beta-dehydrogenase 1-like protein-like n=1 Tax=Saccoglossus kowalevskii TaxID=10224 RepID=A0ABM0GVR2_SACKO|nr:PREDICTED: hydroxysteroid 11-beta-dehydrogenase 1-like protein-like [Saccoglossus kowalevskii]
MRKFWKFTGLFIVGIAIYIAYTSRDTFDPESIRGKRVVVTGASTGIGEQVAYQYAKLGANMLITARRENLLKQVVKKCLDLGAQSAKYISLDMQTINETGKLITEAEKTLGGLDYLVLNHALYNVELWDGDIEGLQALMNINFISYVNLATKALPMLSKSNGSIAVVSAGAGLYSLPGLVAYSASKHALNGFFEGLRLELKYKEIDVAVTLLLLGGITTDHVIDMIPNCDTLAHFGDPTEATSIIVKATSSKQTWAYYPWADVRIMEIVHTISRDLCNIMIADLLFPMLRMMKI